MEGGEGDLSERINIIPTKLRHRLIHLPGRCSLTNVVIKIPLHAKELRTAAQPETEIMDEPEQVNSSKGVVWVKWFIN